MMLASALNRDNIVDFIADIFHRRGAESYLGEAVTMSQHMLQAAQLADKESGDEQLIAAALLHDIGHYTNEFPDDALHRGIDNHHDTAGAAILAPYYPALIVDCVRHHVAAKRYLCRTEPGYFNQLSAASVHTLGLQGGPMNANEARKFGRQTHLKAIIQVRKWDERAKTVVLASPSFETYVPLLNRLIK